MSSANSPDLYSDLTVISATVEGLTAIKASLLSGMCKVEHSHCLNLKESHRDSVYARLKLSGTTLIAERPHKKHGNAIFVREDLKLKSVSIRDEGIDKFITVVLPSVVVHSVYKPPSERFVLPVLGHRNLLHIVIGDFNSHSTT